MEKAKNDLLAVLIEARNGAIASDLSSKFQEVMDAVLDHGGKGELNIKLTIEPARKGMGGVVLEVDIEHSCKLKKPEPDIGKARFFLSKEGKLTRDDPAQEQMFGKDESSARRSN